MKDTEKKQTKIHINKKHITCIHININKNIESGCVVPTGKNSTKVPLPVDYSYGFIHFYFIFINLLACFFFSLYFVSYLDRLRKCSIDFTYHNFMETQLFIYLVLIYLFILFIYFSFNFRISFSSLNCERHISQEFQLLQFVLVS